MNSRFARTLLLCCAVAALGRVSAGQAKTAAERAYKVGDLVALAKAPKKATGTAKQEGAASTKGKEKSRERSPALIRLSEVGPPKLKTSPGRAVLRAGKPSIDQLQGFLADCIEPGFRDADQIDGFRGTLLVNTDEPRHAWLKATLNHNRGRAKTKLRVWSAVLTTKQLPVIQGLVAGADQGVLPGAKQKDLLAVMGRLGFRPHPAQAVEGFLVARLERADRTRFVRDYDLEVGNSSFLVAPIFGTVKHGYRLDLQLGFVGAETLAIRARFLNTALKRPVRLVTAAQSGAADPKLTVHLPRTEVSRAARRARLRGGEAALMFFPMSEKRHLGLVLQLAAAARCP